LTLALGIFTFFVILAVLILVHELGHFTLAKLMGVRVQEFGLGFPPRIKGWSRGGTLYSINAIPIGGFVRMLGENGSAPEPDSFGAKKPWQRLVILVSGPGMNILLAIAIFFFAFAAGSPRGETVITRVQPGSPAAAAGLQAGDRIVALDGHPVQYLDNLQTALARHLGHTVTLTVRNGMKNDSISLVPRIHPPRGQGPMGVVMARSVTVSYSPVQALKLSGGQVIAMVTALPLLLANVSQSGGSGVTGPVGIARITTTVVKNEPSQGPGSLFAFVALLSANLGVLNLLPVPALDGGRIVFVLLSWIRRRSLDPEIEGLIHLVGMAVLLVLILVISYQDVMHWISGGSF
jgi:regulator of sigma E protease